MAPRSSTTTQTARQTTGPIARRAPRPRVRRAEPGPQIRLMNQATGGVYCFACMTCMKGHRTGRCGVPGSDHHRNILMLRGRVGRPTSRCTHTAIDTCTCHVSKTLCTRLTPGEWDLACAGEIVTVRMYDNQDELRAAYQGRNRAQQGQQPAVMAPGPVPQPQSDISSGQYQYPMADGYQQWPAGQQFQQPFPPFGLPQGYQQFPAGQPYQQHALPFQQYGQPTYDPGQQMLLGNMYPNPADFGLEMPNQQMLAGYTGSDPIDYGMSLPSQQMPSEHTNSSPAYPGLGMPHQQPLPEVASLAPTEPAEPARRTAPKLPSLAIDPALAALGTLDEDEWLNSLLTTPIFGDVNDAFDKVQ